MARCPVCGKPLDWAELIEQMLSLEGIENILKNREKFMETLENFTFKCPHCGEEFYGRYLPREEAEKVFELLNEFKG
jgi:rRNA maturation protein Nop10